MSHLQSSDISPSLISLEKRIVDEDLVDAERLLVTSPHGQEESCSRVEVMIASALETQCSQLILPKLRQCVTEEMARATQVLMAQRLLPTSPPCSHCDSSQPLTPTQPGLVRTLSARTPSQTLPCVAEDSEEQAHDWSRRHMRTNTVSSFLDNLGTGSSSSQLQVNTNTPKATPSELVSPRSASSMSKLMVWDSTASKDELDIGQSITSVKTLAKPAGDSGCSSDFKGQQLHELLGGVQSTGEHSDVDTAAMSKQLSASAGMSNHLKRNASLSIVVPTPDAVGSDIEDDNGRKAGRASTTTTRDYFLQKLGTAARGRTMITLFGRESLHRSETSFASSLGRDSCARRLRRFISSERFDSIVGLIILANAAFLGLQSHYLVKDEVPSGVRYIEVFFVLVMTLEVLMRLWVHRLTYFCGRGWPANWLDLVIVVISLFEEIGKFIHLEHAPSLNSGSNITYLRVLRVARIIRMIRLVHVLRLISELHTLVRSIASSMKSLGWTVALFFLMVYTLSVFVVQLVADKVMTSRELPYEDLSESSRNLVRFYGSLTTTMLSLFQAVTGGVDWNDILKPLMEEISPWCAVLLVMYVAFATFAMLNVVTGIFVESVVKSAKADKDLFLISNARSLFESLEGGVHAQMTWELFESMLDRSEMHEFFEAIDVDRSEAKGLFFLLDLDQSGAISAAEFLNGCLRLRGPAKALDLALLVQEVHAVSRRLIKAYRLLETHTAALQHLVPSESISMSNILRSQTGNLEVFS
eukprot:TRINITY_DN5986_c0_g2_i1.p1 TRINITY_DN5986_c0_g2~~TRINITY_DN5986_c0_g2_i1.p1  ORF type:complete len:756 (-),score=82.88 TRINITY_DN5986_c0_g2_i1:92-2359(-)